MFQQAMVRALSQEVTSLSLTQRKKPNMDLMNLLLKSLSNHKSLPSKKYASI